MKESTGWGLHILAAIVLLFLLGLHMIFMHMPEVIGVVGAPYHDFNLVVTRVKETSYFIFYTLFLAFALYHGFYGLRGIILELVPIKAYKFVTCSLFTIGLLLFALGSYVRIVVYMM